MSLEDIELRGTRDKEGEDSDGSNSGDELPDMDKMRLQMEASRAQASSSSSSDKKKEKKVESGNPNARGPPKMHSIKTLNPEKSVAEMSRKEREQHEAEKRKERARKAYEDGTSEQAQKDKARLEEVKARREKARLEREASASVEKKQEESIFAARAEAEAAESAQAGDAGDDELEKFTSIQIKKMNPKQLKEALKARDLPIQGSKKDLVGRLSTACGL